MGILHMQTSANQKVLHVRQFSDLQTVLQTAGTENGKNGLQNTSLVFAEVVIFKAFVDLTLKLKHCRFAFPVLRLRPLGHLS